MNYELRITNYEEIKVKLAVGSQQSAGKCNSPLTTHYSQMMNTNYDYYDKSKRS